MSFCYFIIASTAARLPPHDKSITRGMLGRFRITVGVRPWPEKVFTGSVAPPSWPGMSRPSTPHRRSADGRDAPGHDDRETTLRRQIPYLDSCGTVPTRILRQGPGRRQRDRLLL